MRLFIILQTANICKSFVCLFVCLVEKMFAGRTKNPINKAKNDVILSDINVLVTQLCPTLPPHGL